MVGGEFLKLRHASERVGSSVGAVTDVGIRKSPGHWLKVMYTRDVIADPSNWFSSQEIALARVSKREALGTVNRIEVYCDLDVTIRQTLAVVRAAQRLKRFPIPLVAAATLPKPAP